MNKDIRDWIKEKTPLKVITGYDSDFFDDITKRYPITNHEWQLNSEETEYVCDRSPNVPRLDPWGRRFRKWTCDDDSTVLEWEKYSYKTERPSWTRWTSVEGVPIKLWLY